LEYDFGTYEVPFWYTIKAQYTLPMSTTPERGVQNEASVQGPWTRPVKTGVKNDAHVTGRVGCTDNQHVP